ncbi:sulfite reductase (NADPH) flavoprotein alpha-component [Bradyrhizobium canariense]|uniref:assimilatory sulfite reductase (NADPH) n=1 Tax=Bradyrhizobium canariense TaxID=255045 RepID=A0A1H2BGQ1_9BRAD|nr:sulfite reductase (NADPH) flavoprotein alpha-component [Bradyrhizobium canariense]
MLALLIGGGVALAAFVGDARVASAKIIIGARLPQSASQSQRVPLTILYASESGNARGLAIAAGKAAARLGLEPHVVDMANIKVAEAAKTKHLLVIASTWGEGEPPQRATDFYDSLMAPTAPRFDGVRYAVLALGDRAYASLDNFCRTGRSLDARLAELGGMRLADRSDCDADYEVQAGSWIRSRLAELTSSDVQVEVAPYLADSKPVGRAYPFEAEIREKVNLNGSHSTVCTYQITLALDESGILYEPGDSIGILPRNDPELIEEMLNVVGISANPALREAMRTYYDITALTVPQIEAYARLSGDQALATLAADEERAAEFLSGGRQLIDLLTAAPRKLNSEQFTGLLRRLQPRLYSIASSSKATPGQVDLLIAAVDYQAYGRRRKGVASMDVAERCRVGDRLRIYLHSNPYFRLPSDPSRSIIMIGPGTGVAPFRAFMQERDATGARGKNWLFFGNQHRADDFLYESEWTALQRRGVLSRLDVAFSRDQPQKIYVQDRMWEARRDLYAWVQEGAAIYVCGNAHGMAPDVNGMLLKIAIDQGKLDDAGAQAWLDNLRREARYLRDVY